MTFSILNTQYSILNSTGAVQLDNGAYSEPIMALNMYKKWQSLSKLNRVEWCKASNIRYENMSNFVTSVESLLTSVNSMLSRGGRRRGGQRREGEEQGEGEGKGEEQEGAKKLDQTALNIAHTTTPTELNLYRLILTWVCSANILTQQKQSATTEWNARCQMNEQNFSIEDIEDLFIETRIISVKNDKKITGGKFSLPFSIKFTGLSFYKEFLYGLLVPDLLFDFLDVWCYMELGPDS